MNQLATAARSAVEAGGRRGARHGAAACALLCLAAGGASHAAAQTAPAAAPPPSVSGAAPQTATAAQASADNARGNVEEVIVTANKRSERLKDVAESVAVVSGAGLAAVGPVQNTGDLINAAPGARFNNLGNPLLSEISLRGSGTERATGADSSVGLYSDGVYIGFSGNGGRNFTPLDSFDVDHVEVLSGPQGALYGRDAEYGVINILTQRPQFHNSLTLDNVYTIETEQNIASVVANYAVSDKLAIRFGAKNYDQSGGFEYNPDKNTYYDHTNGYLLRGQVRYADGPLDATLMLQAQELHVPSFYSVDRVDAADPRTGYPGLATFPLGFYQPLRSLAQNGTDYAKEDVDSITLFLNYDLGFAKATLTSSWREIDTIQEADTDYIDVATEAAVQALGQKGNYPFTQQSTFGHTNSYYEDLHLAGRPFLGDRVTWLLGFEYLSQPQTQRMTLTQNPCATAQAANPVVGQGACTGTPMQPVCVSILPGSTCGAILSPYGNNAFTRSDYDSWAPYGSLSLKLLRGLTLTGDLRYSHDAKTATNTVVQLYTNLPYPYLTGGVIPQTNYKLSSDNTTYTATLSYKLPGTDDGLVYTKVGTGYRVGGFNFGHTPPLLLPPYPKGISAAVAYAPVVPQYGPETSTSYEVGLKGTVAPHTYATLAAYYQDTESALAGVMDGCTATNACEASNTNYTVNAGTVHGSGLEAQVNGSYAVLTGRLNLQLRASTQVAKYVSNPAVGVTGEKLNGLPIVGTQIAENPKYLLDATANYVVPITDDIAAFANLHLHGQWGGIQDPQTNVSVFYLDDYQDLDLRAGIDYRTLEFAVIVRNLTNEFHRTAQFQQAGVNTLTGAALIVPTQIRPNLPSTIGLEVKYRWGG